MITNPPLWSPGVHTPLQSLGWGCGAGEMLLQPADPSTTAETPGTSGWPPQGRGSSAPRSWYTQVFTRFGVPAKCPLWPEREGTSFGCPVWDALISCPGIMAETAVPFRGNLSPIHRGSPDPQLWPQSPGYSACSPKSGLFHLKYRTTYEVQVQWILSHSQPRAPGLTSHPSLPFLASYSLPGVQVQHPSPTGSLCFSFSIPGEDYLHGWWGGGHLAVLLSHFCLCPPRTQARGDPNQAGVLFLLPWPGSRPAPSRRQWTQRLGGLNWGGRREGKKAKEWTTRRKKKTSTNISEMLSQSSHCSQPLD